MPRTVADTDCERAKARLRASLLGGAKRLARRDNQRVAELIAIFITEEIRDDGERVGPIDLFDPKHRKIIDDTEWMTETEARKLAQERGWHFRVD